jgi:DNA-binding transcriptional ArsR family regulator
VADQKTDLVRLAKMLKALSNVHRLRVYQTLFSGELASCCDRIEACEPVVAQADLVKLLGLAQSTISQHLNVLEEAGLVITERRGPWTCYRASREQATRLGEYFRSLAEAQSPLGDRRTPEPP